MVPDRVTMKRIRLRDPQAHAIRNTRLEFRENSKVFREPLVARKTDDNGVADLSGLVKLGLLRMSISAGGRSEEFPLQLAKDRLPGEQRADIFDWRCGRKLVRGLMVRP